jgi:transcriptional regulator with XRE-family HTH domain
VSENELKKILGKRLEKLKETLNYSNLTLAEKMNTDNSTVGKIIKGNNNITAEMMLGLYANGVDLNWLFSGKGDILRKEKSGPTQEPDPYLPTLIKKQIDELKVNFDTFVESLPAQTSENHERKRVFEKLTGGKSQKADRQ